MNKATALFAITTIVFAGTSAYLARALRAERAQPAQEADVAPAARAGESAQPVTTIGKASPEHGATSGPGPITAANVSDASAGKLPARVTHRTYAAAQLAFFKLEIEKELPDLAAALSMQPEEAAAFIGLLARQRSREAMDARKGKPSEAVDPRDAQKGRDMLARTAQREQAEFLGEARAAGWIRYQQTLGTRGEVRELRMTLADSDYPMRRDQYEPLVTALADEQLRHERDRAQLRRSERDPANPTHAEVIDYMGKRLVLIEESLDRRRKAAAAVLDSEQLRRYQAMIDRERLRAQVEYDAFVTLNAEAARAK